MNLKRRIYETLEVADEGDRASQPVDIAILSLIGLNIGAVIAESVDTLHS